MNRAGRLRRALGAAATLTAMIAVSCAGTVAWAELADSSSASHELASGALDAPTAPAILLGTCLPAVGDAIVLSWTRTLSLKADGYEILRAVGDDPFSSHALVAGLATESFTDIGLAFSTEYRYVVKAKKEGWRSVGTLPVSKTTRSALCI